MKNIAMFRDGKVCLLVLVTCGLLLLSGCEPFPWTETPAPPPTNPPSNGGEQPPQPASVPDLRISAIEVFPKQPQAGQQFALNVYVENIGQAKSGDYEIAISIKDVSRGYTYPVGTFRNSALYPGDNVTAYTSTDRLVNDPGSFQVHVEILPFNFEDGNPQNNSKIWAFTVN